jgi:hypothetical protein
MTIDKLIEAVEAGDNDAVKKISQAIASAARDKGQLFPSHDVLKAYSFDSTDAARAVCKTLLPGWAWNIDAGDGAYVENRGDFGLEYSADIPNMPARSLLLAILKAKQAEEQP